MSITPILLKGDARNLTCVTFSRDSDLIFAAAKDKSPQVWNAHNGECLGTFEGHEDAVMDLDVSSDSKFLLSVSDDKTIRFWQVLSGKEICSWDFSSGIRSVAFAEGDDMFLAGVSMTPNDLSAITGFSAVAVFALNGEHTTVEKDSRGDDTPESGPLRMMLIPKPASVTAAVWAPLNSKVIVACDDGCVRVFDFDTEEEVSTHQLHTSAITSLSYSKDRKMLVTSSLDMTARILDAHTLETIKEIKTDVPLNAAVLSSILNHAIAAGGESATGETELWHTFEELLASVNKRFGPGNVLAIAPNDKIVATGGEDGFIRLHHFDKTYINSIN